MHSADLPLRLCVCSLVDQTGVSEIRKWPLFIVYSTFPTTKWQGSLQVDSHSFSHTAQPIGCNLGFNVFPKDTSICRELLLCYGLTMNAIIYGQPALPTVLYSCPTVDGSKQSCLRRCTVYNASWCMLCCLYMFYK